MKTTKKINTETTDVTAEKKTDFPIPSPVDILVNLTYWLDMARMTTNKYLNELPKPDNDTKS